MHVEEISSLTSPPCSPDQAFEYCARLTNAHYENFPVASLFLPEERRQYIQAIYAFSRVADDYADESSRPQHERLELLNDWEQRLRDCFEGKADHPIFIALRETVVQLNIPIEPLLDLLSAFKQDVTVNRYRTFDDVMDYCRRSANPVGRLVLMIFGHRDEELFLLSDAICSALQLTNFWQDVDIDRRKDRLYLPLDDMKNFGFALEDWLEGRYGRAFQELMRFQVERTRGMFYRGAALPSRVEKELQVELRLVWFGGMEILAMLDRVRYDILKKRPRLSLLRKSAILGRALFIKDLSSYRKKIKVFE